MRYTKLKCLIGFLSVVFILALIPSRITLADIVDSGSCGENLTWTISDEGVLTISGTGAMKKYNTNTTPWVNYKGGIQSIVISNGVTSIGSFAFDGCTNLTNVTFADSVSTIGNYAFRNCSSLKNITLPVGLTTLQPGAFSGCSSLESVAIPNGVTSISGTFIDCTNLTNITLPNGLDTIGSNSFRNCTSLKSIVIPESVTSIGAAAFFGCSNLSNISLPDGITAIGDGTFQECTKITEFTIPSGVKSIGNSAFSTCRGLTKITIPDGVTSIGVNAFLGCIGLTDLSIPDSVTTIGAGAFNTCKGLTNIKIPDGVTEIGDNAFAYCTSLSSATLPKDLTSISNSLFENCTNLTNVTIPDNITSIGSRAFCLCKNLSAVKLPDSVTSIGEAAFSQCEKLTGINIPKGVTTIGASAFANCISITSITIPDGVTQISDRTFENCVLLKKVTLPNSVTSIGSYAFNQCLSLTGIDIPDGVTTIGESAFAFCESITSITIPDGVTSLSDSVLFRCDKLTTLKFSDKITSIGAYAISGCYSLTSFTIPDTVTSIGSGAFYYCENLKSIKIPDGVTSILDYTFQNCTNLESVTLPERLTSIGKYAFSECTSLSSIIIPIGVTSIGECAFYCYSDSSLKFIVVSNYAYSNSYNAFSGISYNAEFHYYFYISYSDDGNGTVKGKYESYGTDVLEITVTPRTDYEVDKVTLSYSNKTIELTPDKEGKYKYTMPDLDTYVYIKATFVTTVASGNCGSNLTWALDDRGTLTISGTGDMTNWYSADFVPWKNYKADIKSVVFSEKVTSIGSYAFNKCTNLKSITIPKNIASIGEKAFSGCSQLAFVALDKSAYNSAAFPGIQTSIFHYYFDITYIDDGHGTISGKAFSYGTDVLEFTVKPNENYEIEKVTVVYANGETEITPDAEGEYVLTMPDSESGIEVKASFKTIVYEIRTYSSSVGNLYIESNYASAGDEITVYVHPFQGYELDTIYVNGQPITGNIFTMPAQITEVSASFKKIQYTVTVRENANGTVELSKNKAGIGDKITVTVTPVAGYELDEIKVNNKTITSNPFTMPAADVTVDVTYKKIEYSVTVVDSENGSVTASKSKATVGDEITLTINPAKGFDLEKVKLNDSEITEHSFLMPAENVNIEASFVKHDLTKVDAKDPTCTENGHKEYYKCSRCKKLFSDADGMKEISEPEVIKAFGHKWDEGEVTKEPSCEEAGIKTFHCTNSGCSQTKTESIAATGHKLNDVPENAPTKTEPGNIKHFKCEKCGKLFSDSDGKHEIAQADTVIPAMGHDPTKVSAKAATCSETGNIEYYECKDDDCGCKKLYSDSYGQHEISAADTVKPALGHDPKEVVAKDPTCTEDGYEKYYKCSRCHKLFSDSEGTNEIENPIVVPKLGHDMKPIEAKKPTHDDDGHKAYFHCDRCEKNFADEEGSTVLTDAEIVIPHIGAAVLGEEITEGDFKYKVTNPRTDGTGTVTIIGFENETEAVVIPSTVELKLDTYRVTRIGPKAFYNNKTIKSVNIGAYVTIIDSYAFAGCSNLIKVYGGARVQIIGSYVFANCSKLSSFTITSPTLKKIGYYAFNKDKKLKTIYIKNTTKLTKSGVKKSLKGSSVKTVKVKKSKVKKYKKYFTKKNCGRKVKVKK